MNHGSLYSGIGGWLLAARWAGIENIFTCEIDKFCNKVLDKHFPDTDRHHDIKETDFTTYAGRIDILSTSDPCQPFSFAGKRGGKADDRYLWPETIRVIREIKPPYVVFENVPGIKGLALSGVLNDLEDEGYWTEPFDIPASAIGAVHGRHRYWIIAYTKHIGIRWRAKQQEGKQKTFNANTSSDRLQRIMRQDSGKKNRSFKTLPSSFLCKEISELPTPYTIGTNDGISKELDAANRTRSLGNSIVPQIAYIIFEAIKLINNT